MTTEIGTDKDSIKALEEKVKDLLEGPIEDDGVLNLHKEFVGVCPSCQGSYESIYEYDQVRLENGVIPLKNIGVKCGNCGVSIKIEANGYFVIGTVVKFDEKEVMIKPSLPPDGEATKGIVTVEHKLDLQSLQWYKDNLELAEFLVIDNKAIRLK